ncbi:hypothetical protein AC249_AIPGENE21554 [Exaiptasia diaphana]|nr:hypothetical protein AC249_AIPGENE21554 [Exaiptasia diaphana]
MSLGNLFHNSGPEKENALLPYRLRLKEGLTKRLDEEDLKEHEDLTENVLETTKRSTPAAVGKKYWKS